MNSEIKSFYIPRVHMDTTEQYIRYIFNISGIGICYRVDFTPYGKQVGFGMADAQPYSSSSYKSAFVHFYSFYPDVERILCFESLRKGMFQRLHFEPQWKIFKNRNPVHTTMMNTHQIVANCCALEERVAQLEKDKEYDSHTIEFMSRRISTLEKNFYQLSEFVFDNVGHMAGAQDLSTVSSHTTIPMLESDNSSIEDELLDHEREQEEWTKATRDSIAWMKRVGKHLDPEWLTGAIENVNARLQVVRDGEDASLIGVSAQEK